MKSVNLRVLALDASSAVTGWAVVDRLPESELRLVNYGELKMKKGHDGYLQLFNELSHMLTQFKPNIIALEDTYLKNTKTLKVLERIRGVVILTCVHRGFLNIEQLNASSVRKRVFGNGKISKEDACAKLTVHFNKSLITKGYDQSDAIALAVATHGLTI